MSTFTFWLEVCAISAVISLLVTLPMRRQIRAIKSMLEMLAKDKKEGRR